jgi:hypothetical protein
LNPQQLHISRDFYELIYSCNNTINRNNSPVTFWKIHIFKILYIVLKKKNLVWLPQLVDLRPQQNTMSVRVREGTIFAIAIATLAIVVAITSHLSSTNSAVAQGQWLLVMMMLVLSCSHSFEL